MTLSWFIVKPCHWQLSPFLYAYLFKQINALLTLKQASMKQWVKQAEMKLPSNTASLCVINQQLWCCCDKAGIVIFDSELQQQRTIPAADMGDVYDVAEMSNDDIIIAAMSGLYHSSNGRLHSVSTCASSKLHFNFVKQ